MYFDLGEILNTGDGYGRSTRDGVTSRFHGTQYADEFKVPFSGASQEGSPNITIVGFDLEEDTIRFTGTRDSEDLQVLNRQMTGTNTLGDVWDNTQEVDISEFLISLFGSIRLYEAGSISYMLIADSDSVACVEFNDKDYNGYIEGPDEIDIVFDVLEITDVTALASQIIF